MRIAAILPHVEVFGGVRRYIEIGNNFVKRGHSFKIYHTDGSPPTWLEFFGETRPLKQVTLEENDIAISSDYAVLDYLGRANARKKIFYCLREHKNNRRVCNTKEFLIMGNSTGICEMVKRKYRRECIEGIGGINAELFHPEETDKDSRQIKILCYGRIYKKRKGIQKAIKAIELLYRRYPSLRLMLFDTPVGSPRRDARQMVHSRVPVTFYTSIPQERMAELYSQADIFVSAEKRAGWSNPCAEAMACKVPVVCAPSGTRDFAMDGETALVFHFRCPFLIAKRVKRLIEDRDLRERIRERGYRKIQEYRWSNLVGKLEKEFKQLL
ncbi:MAG: glycosyltransferase family 4 protein [Elusimicrobiota bacterium]|nr:glycosyltransferase family 4 protein [Elusimicrobiota bacterium]